MTGRRAYILSSLLAGWVTSSAAPSASLQEGDLGERLVTANRILAMEGLVGPYGHVSARADGESFWVADHRSPDSVERKHLKKVRVGLSLELEARSQLIAGAAGSPIFFSPQETARFSRTTAVEHAWQYYADKLSRQQRD